MCRRHGVEQRPVPEAWQQKGKVEKRIDLYKNHLVKLNHEVNLTKDEWPHWWCSKLSWVANQHLRVEGFSPFQAVFGRDLRVPTDLLSDEATLPALSAATIGPGGRAEEIRQAASKTFFEFSSREAIARQSRPGMRRPGSQSQVTWCAGGEREEPTGPASACKVQSDGMDQL
jgi:hypothetical protein